VKGWVRTKRSQKEFSFIEVNDGSSPKGIQVRPAAPRPPAAWAGRVRAPAPPHARSPPPRTKWTRRVPHSVLIGHAASQVVANADMATYDAVDRLGTGAAVAVRGTLVESQGAGQKFEVKVHGAPPARPAPRRTAPRAEWRRAARQASAIEVVGDCADPKYPLQKKRHSLEFLRSIAHLRPRTNTIASVARVRSALAQATHPPPPRTKWTRNAPHPVLIGHAAPLTPY